MFLLGILLASGLAGATQAQDDVHTMDEDGGEAVLDVVENDVGNGASIAYSSKVWASGNSGQHLVTVNGVAFYAYSNLDDGSGYATGITGFSSLTGVSPSDFTFTFGDLELEGVHGDSLTAYEVFAERDGSVEPWLFARNGATVGEGSLDVVTAVVDRNESSPTLGLATGFGQITLTGPQSDPFFAEVLSLTCGTGVLFFDIDQFVPTRYSDPELFEGTGVMRPLGFTVTNVTQAARGLVTIDPAGHSVRYTPDIGFDGFDSFTYTVTDCAGDTSTATVTVTVIGENDAPVAAFSPQDAQVAADAPVQLTDLSTDVDGTVVAWNWKLDGATVNTTQHPQLTLSAGAHTLCLNVQDDDGAWSATSACTTLTAVAAENAAPTASFTWSPESPRTFQNVTFVDNSTDADGSIVSWNWTFGDGGWSSDASPTHAFSTRDTFDVCLRVTDDAGANATHCESITVVNNPPHPDFTYSPSAPTTQDPVQFTDLSTDAEGALVAWNWSFGDGGWSSVRSPTHTFAQDGEYVVILAVTDDAGSTVFGVDTVVVTNVAPVAAFSWSPAPASTVAPTAFTDASHDADGSIVAWAWSFGDGTTSTDTSPTKQFVEGGTYTVTLTVTDDDGATSSATREVKVVPVVMHGRAAGVLATLLDAPHAVADTGHVRTTNATSARAEAHHHPLESVRVEGASSLVELRPGDAYAVAEVARVDVVLPLGHTLSLIGAEAEARAACFAEGIPIGTPSVAQVLLDGVPLAGFERTDSFLLPGGVELALSEVRVDVSGQRVDATAARVVVPGVGEVRVGVASAWVEDCPASIAIEPQGSPLALVGRDDEDA